MTRRWPTAHSHRQSSRARPLGTREENSRSKKPRVFYAAALPFQGPFRSSDSTSGDEARRFSVFVLKLNLKVLLKGPSEFCVWILGLKLKKF